MERPRSTVESLAVIGAFEENILSCWREEIDRRIMAGRELERDYRL
jgi:hypothetical protein